MQEIGLTKIKAMESAEIASHVEAYLNQGGDINKIGMGICTHSKKLSYNTTYESVIKLNERYGEQA
jgi:hypothetical protein